MTTNHEHRISAVPLSSLLLRYIDSIIDSVHWMGHVPTKITHTSDYFEQMFEFAIKLIKKDKAFICHQVFFRTALAIRCCSII